MNVELEVRLVRQLGELAYHKGMDPNALLKLMLKSFTKGPVIYGLNDKLGFGKYSGEYIENVLRGDPRYMKWLVETSQWFKLDQEALELLEDFVGDIKPYTDGDEFHG